MQRWLPSHFIVGLLLSVMSFSVVSTSIEAAVPTDQLLPSTTKGVILIPDFDLLESQFNKTQLGQLMADPVMQPFADDLKRQLRDKWSKNNERLGLSWDDIIEVPGGEIGMGLIKASDTKGVSFIVVDVTGKASETDALLAKVDKNLKEKKATLSKQQMSGLEVLVYTHVKKGDEPVETAVFAYHREEQQLIATDGVAEMRKIVARFGGKSEDRLTDLTAYQKTMGRCAQAAGDLKPEIRWFFEPFGYVDALRSRQSSADARKGQDMLAILKAEGFDAIQGVGGYVNFFDGSHDILHRTMVYAPAVVREPGDTSTDKYNLAARMLKFMNGNSHQPPTWIHRQLATFNSLNADLKNAFESSKTLVNRMANDEIFEDVLKSLINDPNGPQIDIRKDLIAHLGERVMVVSDYELPITPQSEQLAIMIELTNEAVVRETIDKLMKADSNARREVVGEGDNQHILWNTIRDDDDELDGVLDIDFDEFEPIEVPDAAKKKEEKALPTQAMAVAHGYLITGTHPALIRRMLLAVDKRETLGGSIDYQLVQTALSQLGPPASSVKTFSRTDEEYRPTYELMRQGKMPESDTLFGKMLNQMLGDDEDDETLREQQIDGTKLPEFQIVRRYLGPAGIFVVSEDEGWFATGIFLSKETPQVVKRNNR